MKLIFWTALFFCIGCLSHKNLHTIPLDNTLPAFDREGHRGCRGLMPENTIPAMTKALDLGVTTLEMDIAITKDGKPILSHEPWFAKEITTKPDGGFLTDNDEKKYVIYHMTYDEVKTFDVGMKPHPNFPQQLKMKVVKPLLADVIDSAEAHARATGRPLPFYNIETKTEPSQDSVYHPKPVEFVDIMMTTIVSKNIQPRVIIQSFDFRTLKYLNQKYPGYKTAMLIDEGDVRTIKDEIDALGFVPTIYSPAYSLVTRKLVEECHHKGMKIIPWTVDDKPTIEKLKLMGVDGIITDYPNLF